MALYAPDVAMCHLILRIHRDGERLLTATVRVAALDAEGFRPTPIPPSLYPSLKALETPAQD